MQLGWSEEERILQRTARNFVETRSSLKRVRSLRDSHGFSRELWREMAALGWLDPELPARFSMILLEEFGRGLLPEPVLACVHLGAGALALGGTTVQKEEHLPAIAAGERYIALAFQERRSRYALDHLETRAERGKGGLVLHGEKEQVMGAMAADWLVVSARVEGGISLFVVPRAASGVDVTPQDRLDGRDAAIVRLTGVEVGREALIGEPGGGLALLERVVDRATIGLCAEMLGLSSAAFDMTLEYLKSREQFGVPIGSFQALQHRAAKMFVELELTRSAVLFAHATVEEGADDRTLARVASIAKSKCAEVTMLVAHEAIQMHGGIGMTDEHDIGLFVKRARVAEMTFGDAAHHHDRFARIEGY
jgi:alkylation response protein AidB-like acyl-CoA dehydrogenase